ncbi:MAG: hypothetical protein ABEJ60_04280 [Halodesulfurarchaeum sp.]
MGIFNELGRQLERFKQSAQAAAEETAEYQCQACGARFHAEFEACPECGAAEIAPTSE